MIDQMSIRERWIACLDMKPVDRLPFWPKLFGPFAKAQREPFRSMDCEAIQNYLDSDRPGGIGSCVRFSHSHCSVENRQENGLFINIYHTPHGALRGASRFDPVSASPHPVEFPIKTVDELQIMTCFYEDIMAEPDPVQIERAKAWLAGPKTLAAAAATGPSPLMKFLQELANIAEGQMLILEHPEKVADLFEAMHRLNCRQYEIIAEHCPADFIWLTENTSTTLLSPAQYRSLNLPHIAEYCSILHGGGKRVVLHMCGHLKAILSDLADLRVSGFEAFTSPTVGNTTFLDGRAACPETCLIGGTNAALWLDPADAIIARLEKDLGELPHHRGLIPSSAGVMPPACSVDTIQKVIHWLRSYPIRA